MGIYALVVIAITRPTGDLDQYDFEKYCIAPLKASLPRIFPSDNSGEIGPTGNQSLCLLHYLSDEVAHQLQKSSVRC